MIPRYIPRYMYYYIIIIPGLIVFQFFIIFNFLKNNLKLILN